MVWHVHHKNGEYAVWSTIADDYITPWTSVDQIKAKYSYKAFLEGQAQAEANIKRATQFGCSAVAPFKCYFEHLTLSTRVRSDKT